MSSQRPANPAFLRWVILASVVAAVSWSTFFVLGPSDRSVLYGAGAVVWWVSAVYWLVAWRRRLATYNGWLEERPQ